MNSKRQLGPGPKIPVILICPLQPGAISLGHTALVRKEGGHTWEGPTTAAGQRAEKQAGSVFARSEAVSGPSALSNITTSEIVKNCQSVEGQLSEERG